MEYILIIMEINIKAILRIISLMVKELIIMRMAIKIVGFGRMISLLADCVLMFKFYSILWIIFYEKI